MTLFSDINFLRTEDLWVLGEGQGQWQREASQEKISFYVPDFFLTRPMPWWVPSHTKTSFTLPQVKTSFKTLEREFQIPDFNIFKKEFSFIREKFLKAVPVYFETSKNSPTPHELEHLLSRAFLCESPHLYPYGFGDLKEGYIGLSPEIFFSLKEGVLKTQALASTRELKDKENLLKDKKDLKEHEIVVDDLNEKLSLLGDVLKFETKIKETPFLAHLETKFEVKLTKKFKIEEITKILHPTAALGGVPQKEVMEFLKTQAPLRNNWGAPFGVSLPETDEFFSIVSIRNVDWGNNMMRIGSGCGIVSESLIEKEWKEYEMKRQFIKNLFKINL